jgi:hypothetical protein
VVVLAIGPSPPISYDSVVVESDFFHSEFYFAGFDLYASFVKRDYQCLVDLEEFFQGVGTCSHVVCVHGDSVSKLFWHVFIHSIVKCCLLDLTCRSASHGESTSCEDGLAWIKLGYYDQSRETPWVVAFLYNWSGAHEIFQHFASGWFSMINKTNA